MKRRLSKPSWRHRAREPDHLNVSTANANGVRKMTVLPMNGATLLILLITPLLWSLPTALMVSELATSIPEEGGFYVWVRRGMGRFMGYQEAWLSLAGSVFEMALYPNLFVGYLGRLAPWLVAGHRGLAIGLAMIALCTAWNLAGVRAMG